MSSLETGRAAIELLLPLALAAGLDLYLTLLLLGTSALLGWTTVAPAPLTDLGSLPVVILAALFYTVEAAALRMAWAATAWNVLNTLVRLVGAATLSLLAISTPGTPFVTWTAVLAAVALTLAVHTARTGWWLEIDLRGAPARTRLLAIGAEDVVVVALLPLILQRPSARVLLALLVVGIGAVGVRRHLAAGAFAYRVVLSWIPAMLARGRWMDASTLPRWAHDAAGASGPGDHAVRCTPVAAWGSAVPGAFRRGWLVVALAGPLFLWRRGRGGVTMALSPTRESRVRSDPFHSRVDMELEDGRYCGIAVPRGGPGVESLHQLFTRDGHTPGTP